MQLRSSASRSTRTTSFSVSISCWICIGVLALITEPLLPAESTVSLPTLTTSRPRSGTCTR